MCSTVTPGGRAPGGASSLVCIASVVIALEPTRPAASRQERPIARGSKTLSPPGRGQGEGPGSGRADRGRRAQAARPRHPRAARLRRPPPRRGDGGRRGRLLARGPESHGARQGQQGPRRAAARGGPGRARRVPGHPAIPTWMDRPPDGNGRRRSMSFRKRLESPVVCPAMWPTCSSISGRRSRRRSRELRPALT